MAEDGPDRATDILDAVGFEPDESVLTGRQAEVLALRERGWTQSEVAESLGTSRANVASVEASARENVRKARETVAFAETLLAPVRVRIGADTDLYDVPEQVFDACDEVDIKVSYTAPELMTAVAEAAGDAVVGREIRRPLTVGVTTDGEIRVRRRFGD